MSNYYETLGIDIDADEVQIKQAYRRMAMKHHPDRNKHNKESEEKFKEVLEAYQTLSDENKKFNYDRKLKSGYHDNFKNFNSDSFDDFARSIFEEGVFRGHTFRNFADIFGHNRIQEVIVNLTFWEAVFGVEKNFQLNVKNSVSENIKISFPSGVYEDERFEIKTDNHHFIVKVNILRDDKFTRDNLDLHAQIEIPFTLAALGGDIDFPHWSGNIKVKVNAGASHDSLISIPNAGIKRGIHCGDMILHCKIAVPKKLTKKQKEILQQFANIEKEKDSLFDSLKNKWNNFFGTKS